MSNSTLATYKLLSPNCTAPRQGKIQGVAIHCTAGSPDHTARQIAAGFQSTKRGASCNYAIGGDGSIALVVDESNRAWCTSSGPVDHHAISIEVASDAAGLVVRPAAVNALIDLLVDICTRNGINALTWTGNRAHAGDFSRCNMQVHRWFAAKSCPGDYLYSLHWEIARRVNARIQKNNAASGGKTTEAETMTDERVKEMIDQYGPDAMRAALAEMRKQPASDWAAAALDWAIVAGVTDGSAPGAYCTREQVAAMLYRFYTYLRNGGEA